MFRPGSVTGSVAGSVTGTIADTNAGTIAGNITRTIGRSSRGPSTDHDRLWFTADGAGGPAGQLSDKSTGEPGVGELGCLVNVIHKVTPPRARLSSLPALREVSQLQVVHGQVAVLGEAGVVPAGLSSVEVVEVDLTLSCGSHLELVRKVWRLVEDRPGQEPRLVSWRNWIPAIRSKVPGRGDDLCDGC